MRAQKPLLLFLAKALLLYVTWELLYYNWLVPYSSLDENMTRNLARLSAALLEVWGYTAVVSNFYHPQGVFGHCNVIVDGIPGILIANPCNGLSLIVLFAGFIIAYPGNWKQKAVYILAGSLLVYGINLIRIQVLIFNFLYSQQSFDFNHKYTYTILVYLCIFMLWLNWANRFANHKRMTAA